MQVDHLQMSVKQRKTEIDALFLVIEQDAEGRTHEIILCCEAKGRRDDILEGQALRQAKAVFKMEGVTQDTVIPIVAKAFAPSTIYIVEFAAVRREDAEKTEALTVPAKLFMNCFHPFQESANKHGAWTRKRRNLRVMRLTTRIHSASLLAASAFAFARTSASRTGAPPWRLLSSAASMNAKISIVSSGCTGTFPVLKKRPISRHSSS